ncbi:YkuS family protein [Oceanirhabdus sp. W0125-5]|uniref:YkuS family protein n=1 Tax=Oceanirhabdus sp. W0125-5 TaxID=2999116 RepID=UPI0022F2FB2A|nr:YkuS family protein [Oceanirhabdus sp. W0125-5]WBW97491.1 YkuS family protein [Oceanirhabdus sp. W0125-5]
MKKVAVQKGLGPIKNHLENEGFKVKEFDNRKKSAKNYLNKFDAVVITGESKDFMGIETTLTNASVINADGMSAEDVKNELDKQMT